MSFRVAVVGAGRMGKLHARIISEMDQAELVCVVDNSQNAAKAVARQRDCKPVFDASDAVDLVDAAIIAVPTVDHIEVARPFVEAGKHVLIEKPFTNDPEAGEELIGEDQQPVSHPARNGGHDPPTFLQVDAHRLPP